MSVMEQAKKQNESEARLEDILFMYDTGEYVPRIAERIGLNFETVKSTLRRHGRNPHREKPWLAQKN